MDLAIPTCVFVHGVRTDALPSPGPGGSPVGQDPFPGVLPLELGHGAKGVKEQFGARSCPWIVDHREQVPKGALNTRRRFGRS